MTVDEFSNEFDTLINAYFTTEEYGSAYDKLTFDEYEKSVFLTKAQEDVVLNLYNGKNVFGDSLEKTEETRRYLSDLIKTEILSDKKTGYTGLSESSVFFELPKDLWFLTYESVKLNDKSECLNNKSISVVPITQDEYYKTQRNPFRSSNERKALRLDIGEGIVEIISKYNIKEYLIRYLAKPTPIILVDLPGELSIDDENIKTECKLNPVLHGIILERAVRMAIESKGLSTGRE